MRKLDFASYCWKCKPDVMSTVFGKKLIVILKLLNYIFEFHSVSAKFRFDFVLFMLGYRQFSLMFEE